jgi:predicted RNase H-like HicB family nuclease
MSTDSGTTSGQRPTITLTENPDGRWTARSVEAEVSAQGPTREKALANLDEVLAAVSGNGGREPTDDELRAVGIDPEENVSGDELPDVLK